MNPKGFHVVIEDAETIFKECSKPLFDVLFLGHAPLTNPAIGVQTWLNSDTKYYAVSASIIISSKIKLQFDLAPLIFDQLEKKFRSRRISDYLFILNEMDEAELSLERRVNINIVNSVRKTSEQILISLGENASIIRKSFSTLGAFSKDLQKFASVIEMVVNSIYEVSGLKAPDTTLYLRLMSSQAKDDLFNLFEKGESREEIDKESLRHSIIMAKPNVSFDEIGGQSEAKEEMEMLALGLKHPEQYKRWGTSLPKGIMLSGPPGNGKTLLAKAFATVVDADFLNIDITDVVSKWYGVAEHLMKAVFEIVAESKNRSIIFFDEVDALASIRNTSHEATQKIVAIMLKSLDGIMPLSNVMVIGATNRIEAVDPAFLRSGRIDKIIEIKNPSYEGCKEIFKIHALKAEKLARKPLFEFVNWNEVPLIVENFSGADIAEIIRRILENKVRKELRGETITAVSQEDILKEIQRYKISKTIKGKTISGFRGSDTKGQSE